MGWKMSLILTTLYNVIKMHVCQMQLYTKTEKQKAGLGKSCAQSSAGTSFLRSTLVFAAVARQLGKFSHTQACEVKKMWQMEY